MKGKGQTFFLCQEINCLTKSAAKRFMKNVQFLRMPFGEKIKKYFETKYLRRKILFGNFWLPFFVSLTIQPMQMIHQKVQHENGQKPF
jgi:hypothetical protein